MIKITSKLSPLYVTPAQMLPGQVGIIRKWNKITAYIGMIVTKRDDSVLATLDPVKRGEYWPQANSLTNLKLFTIEILPKGTVLEITL